MIDKKLGVGALANFFFAKPIFIDSKILNMGRRLLKSSSTATS